MIAVNEPLLNGRESEYLASCLKSGWISSSGPFIDKFEEEWSRYCGRKYGISVCNGTAALQTAIAALDLQNGDEVIMRRWVLAGECLKRRSSVLRLNGLIASGHIMR